MNDVSILLPLPGGEAELGAMLTPASEGSGGTLLPENLYQSATGIPLDAGALDDVLAYSALRLTGLRFDPCFAQIGPVLDASACENQLRLIFQPLTLESGRWVALDGAVHAFYSLTRAELLDAVSAVAALRLANGGFTDLGPLQVHPVIAAEGLTGPMATGLFEVILKYSGLNRLVRFTTFQVGDLSWSFNGYNVSAGASQPMVIPSLPAGATSETINPESGLEIPNLSLQVSPTTTSADDIGLLLNATVAVQATPTLQKAAYDAALRVENPNFESPNTIDCASCHLAGPARTLVGEGKLGLSSAGDPNAFAANAAYVSALDMDVTTGQDTQGGHLNLHAFSYVLSDPLINQRVINETAAIVAYLGSQ